MSAKPRVVLCVGVLTTALWAAGCSEALPETLREPAPAPVDRVTIADSPDCAGMLTDTDLHSVDARFSLAVDVVDAVRSGRCAEVDDAARVCRSLFLIGLTDPLVGFGLGLDAETLHGLAERYEWTLGEGIAAAEERGNAVLASALGELANLDVGAAIAAGPEDAADIAVERAKPSIVNAIAAAEPSCS